MESLGLIFESFPAHTTDLTLVALLLLHPGTQLNHSNPHSMEKPLHYQVFTKLD